MNPETPATHRPVASMAALVEQLSQSRSNTRIHGSINPQIGSPAAPEAIPFEALNIPEATPAELK